MLGHSWDELALTTFQTSVLRSKAFNVRQAPNNIAEVRVCLMQEPLNMAVALVVRHWHFFHLHITDLHAHDIALNKLQALAFFRMPEFYCGAACAIATC